jgi:hypothetical protein
MGAPVAAGAPREPAGAKDGAPPVSLYCYCDDVDAVAASARLAGARVVEEPADKFYGDRTCLLIDPDGHSWAFATHKFEMAPDAAAPPPPRKPAGKAGDPDKTETMPAAGRADPPAAAPEPARAGAAGPG